MKITRAGTTKTAYPAMLDSDLDGKADDSDKVDGKDASELGGKVYNIYGDGSDGAITDSADITRSGILYCTTYTLDSGVTVTVGEKCLAIFATDSITINGTINADGKGGSGGAGATGSTGNGSAGSPGQNGYFVAGGSGGNGASSYGGSYSGGAGGAGGSAEYLKFAKFFPNSKYDDVLNLSAFCGAGGGGGGAGAGDGSSNGGNGGNGGAGGGAVILIAPSITIAGTISCKGINGANGGNASGNAGGGGGGGGGAGGIILIITNNLSDSGATYDVGGGIGGAGGTGATGSGGKGSDGSSGYVIKLTS